MVNVMDGNGDVKGVLSTAMTFRSIAVTTHVYEAKTQELGQSSKIIPIFLPAVLQSNDI